MNRRIFTISAFLGLLGLKAQGQQNNGVVLAPGENWTGPYDDGEGGCYSTNGTLVGLKRVPCKEGDEYCPLGHSQKPGNFFVKDFGQSADAVRICALCGVVYALKKGKTK